MPAILPSLTLDAPDKKLSRYFLPYQIRWIHDQSPMCLAEKSVRIGWTFADALKNVRKRLLHKNRDYLFATKDEASAVEYMRTVQSHAELFNYTKYIVSHGEDRESISGALANGEKFTVEMKFNYVKFENGSRILAFSSNPYAMAVFGGDVGLDEFAKHQQAEKLWETAQGRAAWGHDLAVWSAHDGTDTLFYQFAQEASRGTGGWSYYRVTMADAVELGLVEKINEVRGTRITREEFMDQCRLRARQPEIFEQAYNCNPCGSTSGIVPWSQIQLCQQDYQIPRLHLEADQVSAAFLKMRAGKSPCGTGIFLHFTFGGHVGLWLRAGR